MSIVKVGIIQMSCSADKSANNQKSIEKIRAAAKQGAQIICLQELFSSLYFCDVESYDNFKLAEAIPGETSNTLAALAKEFGQQVGVQYAEGFISEKMIGIQSFDGLIQKTT